MYITRNGRHVPEQATDQRGTEMLVRTVSSYTDGKLIDRPQVCVAVELAGDVEAAQRLADDLDRRGYLPPAQPMTRAEWARAVAEHKIPVAYAALLWEILGRGVPSVTAIRRLPQAPANAQNMRKKLVKIIKAIGWE